MSASHSYGWATGFHPEIGQYFIDHNTWKNYLPEDMDVFFAQQKAKFTRLITATQKSLMHRREDVVRQNASILEAQHQLDTLTARAQNASVMRDPQRHRFNVAETKLRVEKLREELHAMEQEVKTREQKVGILQSEFAELESSAQSKPFYDHVATAQERIRELERMSALIDRHSAEREEMERKHRMHLANFRAIPGVTDSQINEETLHLKIAESSLKSRQVQEVAELQKILNQERVESEKKRLVEMESRTKKQEDAKDRQKLLDNLSNSVVEEVALKSPQPQSSQAGNVCTL